MGTTDPQHSNTPSLQVRGSVVPVITDIKEQVRNKQRRSVFIDGEYAFGVSLEEVVAYRLAVGQEVSPERLDAIIVATDLRRAKECLFRLLSMRAYSESELRSKLRAKQFADDLIERALSDLRETGLVNDRQFAETFVRSRMSAGQSGRRRLEWELRSHGVDRQVVAESLAEVGEESEYPLALEVAARRLERLRGEEPEAQRRKIALFLQRRGFAYENISKVLDTILPPE